MEEEKKIEEMSSNEPIESVPASDTTEVMYEPAAESLDLASPVEAPAEVTVTNGEEAQPAPNPGIESLDDAVESLDDAPASGSGEVVLQGVDDQASSTESVPEVPPVVPKATENAVYESPDQVPPPAPEPEPAPEAPAAPAEPVEEPKKEEPKAAEPKKEEKKQSFLEANSSLVKILILGGVLIAVALVVNFMLNGTGAPIEEEEEEIETPVSSTKIDSAKASSIMKSFELYDNCGTNFLVSLSNPNIFTSTVNDLDKAKVTNIVLSKFAKGTEKITNEEFQAKVKTLFDIEGEFEPSEKANQVLSDGTCQGFTYDSTNKVFTKSDSNTCTTTCSEDAKYSYFSKITEAGTKDGQVSIEYKVLYGFIEGDSLKLFSDINKGNLINSYSNKATDGTHKYDNVTAEDYAKGTTVKFVFKEDGSNYKFIKSQVNK